MHKDRRIEQQNREQGSRPTHRWTLGVVADGHAQWGGGVCFVNAAGMIDRTSGK